jgi:hypothetical protein
VQLAPLDDAADDSEAESKDEVLRLISSDGREQDVKIRVKSDPNPQLKGFPHVGRAVSKVFVKPTAETDLQRPSCYFPRYFLIF